MEYDVRPYSSQDREAVRAICTAASDFRVRSESKRLYLFKTRCDYYLDCEPENAFVAWQAGEDGAQTPVGYVLCAADCEAYARRYLDRYLPKIKEYSKMRASFARADVALYGRFAAFFPAHLRMAVLPSARGRGVGEALLESVRAHLTAQKCKGMLLVVDKKNRAERDWCASVGFSLLREVGGVAVFGMDL